MEDESRGPGRAGPARLPVSVSHPNPRARGAAHKTRQPVTYASAAEVPWALSAKGPRGPWCAPPAAGSCPAWRAWPPGPFLPHPGLLSRGVPAPWPPRLGLYLGFPIPCPVQPVAPGPTQSCGFAPPPLLVPRTPSSPVGACARPWGCAGGAPEGSSDLCSELPGLTGPRGQAGPPAQSASQPGLWAVAGLDSLNQRGPEDGRGCRRLAELAEGRDVDEMAGERGQQGGVGLRPVSRCPSPASAPGSWLTPALHVWDGWGSESLRG